MAIAATVISSRLAVTAAILLAVIVLGSAFQPFLKGYQDAVSSSGPEQLFNAVFVTIGGYPLFSGCFFALYKPNKPLLLLYGINTATGLILTVWFFGPLVFSRWDVWRGGHCEDVSSDGSCTRWISIFDASGHAYATTSMTLVLVAASDYMKALEPGSSVPIARPSFEGPLAPLRFLRYFGANGRAQTLAAVLFSGWLAMLVVTSLFFHTFSEKLVGYCLGAAVPLGWYIWMVKVEFDHLQTLASEEV